MHDGSFELKRRCSVVFVWVRSRKRARRLAVGCGQTRGAPPSTCASGGSTDERSGGNLEVDGKSPYVIVDLVVVFAAELPCTTGRRIIEVMGTRLWLLLES